MLREKAEIMGTAVIKKDEPRTTMDLLGLRHGPRCYFNPLPINS